MSWSKKLQLRSYIIYIDTLLTWKIKQSLLILTSWSETRPDLPPDPARWCDFTRSHQSLQIHPSHRSTSKAWLKTPELRAAPDNNLSSAEATSATSANAENQELQYANWLAEVSPKISKIQWPKIKSTRGTHFCRFSEGSTWGHRLPMRSWVFLS
jgi:hypothetical protein